MTGIEVFDRTLQTSNDWLKDVMLELNFADRHKTYLAFKGVVYTLRDRLPVNEAVHLWPSCLCCYEGCIMMGGRPQNARRK